jgi:DNA-binding transcriptional MerR regulator
LISLEKALPSIPAKRYFTIGEVGDLCGVKPHVLRYWEQEFTQLRPMKRRGNRRYYQHHEVLMIRRIRDLLYDQGFTISGARNKLQEIVQTERDKRRNGEVMFEGVESLDDMDAELDEHPEDADLEDSDTDLLSQVLPISMTRQRLEHVRRELTEIRDLLAA